MNSVDRVLTFDCAGETLVGVITVPDRPRDTAVLVIVGGPQYRVGSHRHFVLLARALASRGYPVLRFDYRGMGDSAGATRTFEEATDDIHAAIDALLATQGQPRRVVLWGLCDGASAALLYWHAKRDNRVAGMCLLNPWLRSGVSLARTQIKHYYRQRLMQPAFWLKLLHGGMALGALKGLLDNLATAIHRRQPDSADAIDFRTAMAHAWRAFPGPLLLVLSGSDYTAKEFMEGASNDEAWRGALSRTGVERVEVTTADHTFSASADRLRRESAVLEWLDAQFAEPALAKG